MTDLNTPSSRAESTSPTSTLPGAAKIDAINRQDLDQQPSRGRSRHAGKLGGDLRRFFAASGLHVILLLMSFTLVLPFVWMVSASLKELKQIGVGSWLPQPPTTYQAVDMLEPELIVERFRLDSPLAGTPLQETVDQTLQDTPAPPWAPTTAESVRKSLASMLNRIIADATNADEALPDFGDPNAGSSSRVEDQRQVVLSRKLQHDQALQALQSRGAPRPDLPLAETDEAETMDPLAAQRHVESALQTYRHELGLLNRWQMDDALDGLVRPSKALQWHNYAEVFNQVPFGRYYVNSIFIACWVTFLQVFTSSLAAFAFARLQWPGRDKVFLLYLTTMMLPGLVMMIPNYQIMIFAGLVDTLTGLILPAAFTAFGTFLLRQFMLTIPSSLDEAAEIDGASKWRVYWDVILPMTRPGLITLAIFTFMGGYHNFFWPLVMLKSQHKYTLPIGLLYFDSSAGQETNLLMAAVTMSVFPMIIIFVVLQKYLVKGIQLGAVKG